MKRLLLPVIAMLFVIGANAQTKRNILNLPPVEGYQLLKCDFHIHTVFSDGMVWPTTRVEEAFEEGIDAISLTEHIEYRPKLEEFVSRDHNRSYEVAKKTAEALGVILIRGTEITREMPPGHFNAIFIEDANPFEKFVNQNRTRDGSNIAETLAEAKRQNAFIFWNHPWFQHENNISEWAPIHEELLQRGLIYGIEVVNGKRYDPVILKWCLDKDLTVISNSDIHTPMVLADGRHRAVTIVFAKERSQNGIREALDARRTVAYMDDNIYGAEELVGQIVGNSLDYSFIKISATKYRMLVTNKSGIPWHIRVNSEDGLSPRLQSDLDTAVIPANSQTIVDITAAGSDWPQDKPRSFTVGVSNAQTGADRPFEFKFSMNN